MRFLSKRWISCLGLALFLVVPAEALAEQLYSCAQPPHKLILLRHAHRMTDSEETGLSKVGWEEAARLVGLLGDEPISTIFVSTKRRTQQTAIPLAAYLEIQPVVIEDTPEGTEQLLARICRSRRTDVLVHVGHSYTLEKLFAAFGFEAPPAGSEPVHEIAFKPRGPQLSRIK